jgi:phosphatidylglycerophosphate synthase
MAAVSGRKIPEDMENPFDNIILRFAERVNPALVAHGVTPNLLTSFSLIFGVAAAVYIYWGCFVTGAILFFMAYVFDCMDGNMARAFDMVTRFGDFYDHVTDMVQVVCFIAAITCSPMLYQWKVVLFVTTLILYVAAMVHVGCQERMYGKSVPCLQMLEYLCPNPDKNIYTTRYFGTGTTVVFIVTFIILVALLNGSRCSL